MWPAPTLPSKKAFPISQAVVGDHSRMPSGYLLSRRHRRITRPHTHFFNMLELSSSHQGPIADRRRHFPIDDGLVKHLHLVPSWFIITPSHRQARPGDRQQRDQHGSRAAPPGERPLQHRSLARPVPDGRAHVHIILLDQSAWMAAGSSLPQPAAAALGHQRWGSDPSSSMPTACVRGRVQITQAAQSAATTRCRRYGRARLHIARRRGFTRRPVTIAAKASKGRTQPPPQGEGCWNGARVASSIPQPSGQGNRCRGS